MSKPDIQIVPLHAAAQDPRTHLNAPTAGLPRDELWRQTQGLLRELHTEFTTADYTSITRDLLHHMFREHEWTPERIAEDRDPFLRSEDRVCFRNERGAGAVKRAFIAIAARKDVIGITWVENYPGLDAKLAQPTDIIRPSARGQGLATPMLAATCAMGFNMGYERYIASVFTDNVASMRRFERWVGEGKAEPLAANPYDPDPRRSEMARDYVLHLQRFT